MRWYNFIRSRDGVTGNITDYGFVDAGSNPACGFSFSIKFFKRGFDSLVVECTPVTRKVWVRFPVKAFYLRPFF